MKIAKLVSVFALVALLTGLTGCATKVLKEADITTNTGANQKTGEACVTNILGVVATGDASINKAAKNGGIKKVSTVDITGKPGFFTSEYCTKVTGK